MGTGVLRRHREARLRAAEEAKATQSAPEPTAPAGEPTTAQSAPAPEQLAELMKDPAFAKAHKKSR